MSAPLRPPGPPIKMADLLVPTVLTLAVRGPLSAENFLTALVGTRVTATHPRHKPATAPDFADRAALAGTRVTAARANHAVQAGTRVTARHTQNKARKR